jgi:hypothetical protein
MLRTRRQHWLHINVLYHISLYALYKCPFKTQSVVVYSPNWKSGKFFTAASLRKNLSLSLHIMQLDQPQCFSFSVPTTTQLLSKWDNTGHRRNKKKVRMQMYGNGDEETHFLFLQSLINRLQHSHMHSHLRTRRNVRTTSSCSSI